MGDSLGCCMCEQCRSDIAAHALIQLPPRNVVTRAGGAISKADSLRIQHHTDVRTAIMLAAQVVKEFPRHCASLLSQSESLRPVCHGQLTS